MQTRSKSLLLAVALAITALFPTPAHASCTVDKQLTSKNIKQLHVEVLDATSGQTLFSKDEQQPARTASVMKVLTAAVALDVLGPDYRITTSVMVSPSEPGKIYLVGAGDVTLSRMPGNITSYYAKAPKLDSLTKQIASWAKASSISISAVSVDSSLFGGEKEWHPTWSRLGLSSGYMAPVSALQIDAARLTSTRNPNTWLAQRTSTPVKQAGDLFVASLNKMGIATGLKATAAKAPTDSVVIASVQSRPVSELVANMLRVSDNSIAEALGRVASIKSGLDGSMASLTPLYKKVLKARGLDVSKISVIDASGLSRLNQVPAALINDLLLLVNQGVGDYESLEAGLPISGESGSLKSRFATGSKVETRGKVIAKTGYILTGYSLAGFLTAKDGTELIFTVYNLAERANANHRLAMDNLVYRFYQCGASLSS
ncbi:MAG: D-alanyl-D-alanine carboxypeptidase [Actinomycetota bacterium]|nr:D-alanyl-D-alanine carboxypeptidase [Actinomycetota bacterium]